MYMLYTLCRYPLVNIHVCTTSQLQTQPYKYIVIWLVTLELAGVQFYTFFTVLLLSHSEAVGVDDWSYHHPLIYMYMYT